MATLALHSEPRRLCSWLRDSHITPNNSRWLHQNLTEVDGKVKAMIKIIIEDADSCARRAEMYYKKRPELMRLLEDLYRAYRTLAERCDHVTGELRMAHRTIPEAFSDQVNSVLRDDQISCLTSEPPLPVSLSPELARRAFFCPDEFDLGLSRKGLKQLVEMFQIGELKSADEHSISEQCSCLSADENLSCNAEDRCAQLENLNQLLRFEVNDLTQRIAEKDQELFLNLSEVQELMNQGYIGEFRLVQVEATLGSLQNLQLQSQEEQRAMALELSSGFQKLETLENCKHDLELEIQHLRDENRGLNCQKLATSIPAREMENEVLRLKQIMEKLDSNARRQAEKNDALERQVYQVNSHFEDLNRKYKDILQQVESVGIDPKLVKSSIEEMRYRNLRLEEICFQEKAEKDALLMKVEDMEEKKCILEGQFCDLHIELESFKERTKAFQKEQDRTQEEHSNVLEANKCLQDTLSKYEEEKDVLIKENSAAIAEALSFSFQSAIFSNLLAQKALEAENLNEEMELLREAYTDTEIELAVMGIEKLQLRELNHQYSLEIKGYKCDLNICEDVASSYYNDLQACTVREALFESKVHEVSGLCKILEQLSVRRCIEIERMEAKISFLESRNKGLEAKLAAYTPAASLEIHMTTTSKNQEFTVIDINEIHPPTTNDRSSSMLDGLSELNSGINLPLLQIIHDEECSWSTPGTPDIMDEIRVKDTLHNDVSDYSSSSYQRSGSEELEISKNTELNEVENGKLIIERLSSDAQELQRLNLSIQELKSKIRTNKKSNQTKAVEYKRLSGQLQNIEASVTELVDVNAKLINTIKDCSSLSCVDSFEQARKRITRQARKGAESIGRLQVDVQKIQYLLLRLEVEENENNKVNRRSTRSRTGVSLSDFLYSHGSSSRKQRKLHMCGCDTKDVLDPSIKMSVKKDSKLAGTQTNTNLLSPCIR